MGKFSDLVDKFSKDLEIYEKQEAQSLIYWLFEHHLGLRRVDMAGFLDENHLPQNFYSDLERLKMGEPIQYILGKAPFYGHEFYVSPATLIPRNETEELVHLILKENKSAGLKVLDIGTGTGCIPISLALEMAGPEVYGLDVSPEALDIARKNAKFLRANVTFLQADILKEIPSVKDVDILVSNPPYIPEAEKAEMHRNVLDFEPALALFVSNEDPLIFYRVIAEKGLDILKMDGKLYFEINENFGNAVLNLLMKLGYRNPEIIKDLNGKDRIVKAIRS